MTSPPALHRSAYTWRNLCTSPIAAVLRRLRLRRRRPLPVSETGTDTMMFASARPMGHFSAPQMKMASMTLAGVQMELERHKAVPMVLTEGYLDCLNRCAV